MNDALQEGRSAVKDVVKCSLTKISGSGTKKLAKSNYQWSDHGQRHLSNFTINRTAVSRSLWLGLLSLAMSACQQPPPDYRPEATLPAYTQGDADNGKLLFKDYCSQCHQLTPGLNKKGPQLMNIYGAPAALLKDYQYSQALQSKDWVWDVKTLDAYIADPAKVLPETKMLSDPIRDTEERADIIAYLSTLKAPVPAPVEENK